MALRQKQAEQDQKALRMPRPWCQSIRYLKALQCLALERGISPEFFRPAFCVLRPKDKHPGALRRPERRVPMGQTQPEWA